MKNQDLIKIYKNNVSVFELKILKENEEILIKHPFIPELELTVGKERKVENVLGVPTLFYGATNEIKDNENQIFPIHKVCLIEEDLKKYIDKLLNCKTLADFKYQRLLKEKGLEVGDKIELENGNKGIVCDMEGEFSSNARYIPLKKDGSLSKAKPRILYGGVSYKVIR